VLEYFEGALADAPAWAGRVVSSATATTASVPVAAAMDLDMRVSIRCETTQTEEPEEMQAVERFLSTALFGVLLSMQS
jgi:hypothetical protein